jgi:hypothetical protein
LHNEYACNLKKSRRAHELFVTQSRSLPSSCYFNAVRRFRDAAIDRRTVAESAEPPRSGAERRVVSGGASESAAVAGVALGPSQLTVAAMNRRRFLALRAGHSARATTMTTFCPSRNPAAAKPSERFYEPGVIALSEPCTM